MKAYIKIFLATSIFWTFSILTYGALTDPIFHYKYTTQIQVLIVAISGLIFGVMNMTGFWFLKQKTPTISGLSNPRQKKIVIFAGRLDEAIAVCKQALESLKILEIKNKTSLMITGNTPRTLFQMGEHIEIRFSSLTNDRTEIYILSKPRPNIPLFDYGTGLHNVTVIEQALKKGAPIKTLSS